LNVLINAPGRDVSRLVQHLKQLSPDLNLQVWPEVERPERIDALICWRQQAGDLANYPGVKLIASLGAGVDHILCEPVLPDGVAVTRLLDASLAEQMNRYLLKAVAMQEQQSKQPLSKVLILGAGQLGVEAALAFEQAGYQACCWGRKARPEFAVDYIHGGTALTEQLADSDVVACLLPLTPETDGILNAEMFAQMKPGCFLVNAARGMHLNEDDLLNALDAGQLGGAWLDVHRREPSPPNLRLLIHPKITMTRHTAAISDMHKLAQQFVANLDNLRQGLPLIGEIDQRQGY